MTESPQDRILAAQITGTIHRHARKPQLTQAEHEAAITELTELANGRADILAKVAGLTAGIHVGHPDEANHLRAAQLCIDAGADITQIPRWTQTGHQRAADIAATHAR